VLVLANAAVVVGLWWRQGGVREVHDVAGLLTSVGRLSGLVGAYLALVQLLLLARVPLIERAFGFERVTAWHRRNGHAVLVLLVVHTGAITVGYALADGVGLGAQVRSLLSDYNGVLLALVALGLLVAVVVTSVVVVRRRLSHRVWHAVHVTAYAAIALAFSHQLATGHEFQRQPVARGYWIALYVAVGLGLVLARVVVPVVSALRHRLRVERVVPEAPGVVSLEIGGRDLDRLRVRAGQFLHWRFLTRRLWWEAHPFSLSAAPDGRRLRITIKDRGDFTRGLAEISPGTRVVATGPAGGFVDDFVSRRVALIAGGVGIAPIRALLEELPAAPGEIAVIYRATSEADVLFRSELDELARRRGADVHLVLGDHRNGGADLLSAARLRDLIPDIAGRDVYVCGPPGMTAVTRANLRRAGVPRRRIVTESFAW